MVWEGRRRKAPPYPDLRPDLLVLDCTHDCGWIELRRSSRADIPLPDPLGCTGWISDGLVPGQYASRLDIRTKAGGRLPTGSTATPTRKALHKFYEVRYAFVVGTALAVVRRRRRTRS